MSQTGNYKRRIMQQYHDLIKHVLDNGTLRNNRTDTKTLTTFSPPPMRFNLQEGFPLVTTKKVYYKGIIHELLWFLSGSTNIKYLVDNGVHIWDEWADENGNLGSVYGKQWRRWEKQPTGTHYETRDGIFTSHIDSTYIDQIKSLINGLKSNPYGRRHIVNAWNVGELDKMALPPCHMFFQFFVSNDNKLSCQLYQRSADVFLGVPFNIASYALLTMMVAQVCGLEVGEFIHVIGDAHIYENHIEQCKLQLTRKPYKLPTMVLDPIIKDIDYFKYEHFELINYKYHPAIKGKVAV